MVYFLWRKNEEEKENRRRFGAAHRVLFTLTIHFHFFFRLMFFLDVHKKSPLSTCSILLLNHNILLHTHYPSTTLLLQRNQTDPPIIVFYNGR